MHCRINVEGWDSLVEGGLGHQLREEVVGVGGEFCRVLGLGSQPQMRLFGPLRKCKRDIVVDSRE